MSSCMPESIESKFQQQVSNWWIVSVIELDKKEYPCTHYVCILFVFVTTHPLRAKSGQSVPTNISGPLDGHVFSEKRSCSFNISQTNSTNVEPCTTSSESLEFSDCWTWYIGNIWRHIYSIRRHIYNTWRHINNMWIH